MLRSGSRKWPLTACVCAVAFAAEPVALPLAPSTATSVCPATCKSWYDGCNNCACSAGGKLGACTAKHCLTRGVPKCNDWDCTTREVWSAEKAEHCRANMKCSGGMVFKECGRRCVATCANPTPVCTAECVPKCECPAGKVFDNGVCIDVKACAVTEPAKEQTWPPLTGWFNSTGAATGNLFVSTAQEGPTRCIEHFEPWCVQVESCTRDKAGKIFIPCPEKQVVFDGIVYKTVIRKCECQRKSPCAGGQVFSSCAPACTATCQDPAPTCSTGCFAKCTCPPSIANPHPVWHDGKCIAQSQCPSEAKCSGGQVWQKCGSACTASCLNPKPTCVKKCVPRCECPAGQVWHGGVCQTADQCPSLAPKLSSTCHCLGASALAGRESQYGVCKRHFKQDKEPWCYVGNCGKALNFRPYRDMFVKYNCEQDPCPCLNTNTSFPDLGVLGSCGVHHSLDIKWQGSRAKHWCFVGGCGKARGYEAKVVPFSDGRNTTLYIKEDCHVTYAPTPAPTPAPPTPAPTTAPTMAPTPQPTHVILPVSVHYQTAKAPYPSWGVGSSHRMLSERDCQDRCMLQKDCLFGTFLRSGGAGVAGECWLSSTAFAAGDKLRECGVPCLSFKKVPFTGTYQDDIPAEPSEVAPVYPTERCQCRPRLHPSLLTTCHDNPFTHVTKVKHISARFHTVPLDGGETHRCRWLRTDPAQPHTHTWIMQDFQDALIPGANVTGGVMKARPPFLQVVRHVPGKAECMSLCAKSPECKYATFMQGLVSPGQRKRTVAIGGEWVTLTYHTCYMSKETYLADNPTYGPVCAGCDNYVKVKCHGCDRKGYECKCCDCHRDGSPINMQKTGFGAFTAKAPWLHEGSTNIKAKYADCATQCSGDPACKVGTYMANGECWLSANAHVLSPGVCDGPCYSFVKTHDAEGEVVAVASEAA